MKVVKEKLQIFCMLKRPPEMEDVPQKMTLRDKLTLSSQILAQTLVDQSTASEAFQLADFNIPNFCK